MENNEKTKGYLIYEDTASGIRDKVEESTDYSVTLYRYEFERDLTPEQARIQEKNRWYSKVNQDIRLDQDVLYEKAKDFLYKKILDKCDGDIIKEAEEHLMNLNVKTFVVIDKKEGRAERPYIRILYDNENIEKYDLVQDMDKLYEELKDLKVPSSYGFSNEEKVYVESLEVDVYRHMFRDFSDKVKKAVAKCIRNNLTYCIKSNKSIVPDEYIEKGIEGIDEWREIKAKANKNNSIEKKMLNTIVADKKKFAEDCLSTVMRKVTDPNSTWSIPYLIVDGMYSGQRTQKLSRKIVDKSTRQEWIDISEDEIFNKVKEYWKNVLQEAYDRVDKIERQ